MKKYAHNLISPDFTNLDFAKQWFPKSSFDSFDKYKITNEYEIEWLEGELFLVSRHYYDHSIGYVSDTEIYQGNFGQCIEFIKNELGVE